MRTVSFCLASVEQAIVFSPLAVSQRFPVLSAVRRRAARAWNFSNVSAPPGGAAFVDAVGPHSSVDPHGDGRVEDYAAERGANLMSHSRGPSGHMLLRGFDTRQAEVTLRIAEADIGDHPFG